MRYFVVTTHKKAGDNTIYYPNGMNEYMKMVNVTIEDKYFDEGGYFKRLHLIPDELASIVDTTHKDITEVNETEALRIAALNEPDFVVNDDAKIRLIEIKTRLGQTLSQDELKAINPDDPTSGIVRHKHLGHRLAELKTKEAKGEFKK